MVFGGAQGAKNDIAILLGKMHIQQQKIKGLGVQVRIEILNERNGLRAVFNHMQRAGNPMFFEGLADEYLVCSIVFGQQYVERG